jgi:hypothetical protein
MPTRGIGLPLTDVQLLLDPTFHDFSGFQSLAREISEHAGLAQLVIASLLVRRDYRLRDFASIQAGRQLFDGAAASLVRVAYRYLHQSNHVRALEGLLTAQRAEVQSLRTQVTANRAETDRVRAQNAVRQRNAAQASSQALRKQTAKRHHPIVQELLTLERKVPRRLWAKLTLQSMRGQRKFQQQSDEALTRTIQRVIKANFPNE